MGGPIGLVRDGDVIIGRRRRPAHRPGRPRRRAAAPHGRAPDHAGPASDAAGCRSTRGRSARSPEAPYSADDRHRRCRQSVEMPTCPPPRRVSARRSRRPSHPWVVAPRRVDHPSVRCVLASTPARASPVVATPPALRVGLVTAAAVVRDRDHERRVGRGRLREPDGHLGGVGVLDHVVQRLLDDAVDVLLLVDLHVQGDASRRLHLDVQTRRAPARSPRARVRHRRARARPGRAGAARTPGRAGPPAHSVRVIRAPRRRASAGSGRTSPRSSWVCNVLACSRMENTCCTTESCRSRDSRRRSSDCACDRVCASSRAVSMATAAWSAMASRKRRDPGPGSSPGT